MLAPSLLGESLALQLTSQANGYEIILDKENLKVLPKLILFYIEDIELSNSIRIEIHKLKQRWDQTPVLIIIPKNIKLSTSDILTFGSEGIIQDPTVDTLKESINILIEGGRVFKINNETQFNSESIHHSYGLGYWLLTSGLSQINKELNTTELVISNNSTNPFMQLLFIGKRRELLSARKLLYWLWGPLEVLIESPSRKSSSKNTPIKNKYNTDIIIPNSSSEAIWSFIYKKIDSKLKEEISNSTDELIALFSLNDTKRSNLYKTLLKEFGSVISKLYSLDNQEINSKQTFKTFTTELRENTVRNFLDAYVRLPNNGRELSVTDYLINNVELDLLDDELPSIDIILNPIINKKPILIDGKYLSIEDPRALIHLEMLIINWIFRTAEIISGEIISSCYEWPELRKYILNPELVSTRELERRRNQINTKSQIQNIFKKPVRLYESKRSYFAIKNNQINKLILLEPRDDELKKLDWLQRQIAFVIELRDALAPQIQAIIQHLGDLIVLLLTKVIGRSIGLIGKGIAQGMGKSLSKG